MKTQLPTLSPPLQRAIVDEVLRQDIRAFTRKTFETVAPGEMLHLAPYIDAMLYEMQRLIAGENTRLIVNLPPRSLKSILFSVVLPAFLLGRDPAKKIICVSYSDELAEKHARDFRAVVDSAWYRRLFPHMRILKNSTTEVVTSQHGFRYATSVTGTLTGRGGDFIILDDPHKASDMGSQSARARVIEWAQTTLLSRLDDKTKGRVVLVMQRLHVDDLSAAFLNSGDWHHLSLPAIAERYQELPTFSGEPFARHPGDILDTKREDRRVLEGLEKDLGPIVFSAQYQQRPIPAEGNYFKRGWISFYSTHPVLDHGDRYVISIDTATKAKETSDYSAITVWLVQDAMKYLLDVIRARLSYTELRDQIVRLHAQYPRATILIEDSAAGSSLIQELPRLRVPVVPIIPKGTKENRAMASIHPFTSGSVSFPQEAHWLEELVAELISFPNGRYDDQVDSIAQALNYIETELQRPLRVFIPMLRRSDPWISDSHYSLDGDDGYDEEDDWDEDTDDVE